MTIEELKEVSDAEVKAFFARKKQPEPKEDLDPEKVKKMLKTLHQPEPRLSSDYDRSIIMSHGNFLGSLALFLLVLPDEDFFGAVGADFCFWDCSVFLAGGS